LATGLASCHAAGVGDQPARRPNLLFLLADDMRWDCMSCVGHPQLETPHLDRLAAGGVLFRNAFVTTSICAPNRACILAGQHQRTTGIKDFATPFTEEQLDRTYPVLLRKAGYRTGFIGKWGVGALSEEALRLPASRFDFWWAFVNQGKYFWEVDGRREHLTTERVPSLAAEFLDGCRPGQPWCLSISFKAPHGPWQHYDPRLADLFTGDDLPTLPETFTRERVEALQPFIRNSLNCRMPAHYDARWGSRNDPEKPARLIAMYYRLIVGLDRAVGRLMAELRRRGMDENTVVVFTSDNGHFLFEQGLFGKWLMYEPSIRVPLIVRDPRLPADRRGARPEEMALTIDFAPTLLAMAGVPIPSEMQGRDLAPLLRGRAASWRKDWFYEHTFTLPPPRTIAKSQGVRTARWKYIRYLDTNPHTEELYDLAEDPRELHDLAGAPEHQARLDELRVRYQFWRKTLPDRSPEPQEYGHYRTVPLSPERAEFPVDFSPQHPLGQSFVAEGQTIHAVRFRMGTWGQAVPCGLEVVLLAGGPSGGVLAQGRIPKEAIRNNREVEWRIGKPVPMGKTLLVRVRPEDEVPPRRLAWYGYAEDLYPPGTAVVGDERRDFDLDLTVVYQDPEGFEPPERDWTPPARTKFPVYKGHARRRTSPKVAGKELVITATIRPAGEGGVIVAQGGRSNGYALYVKGGRLAMAVRHGQKLTEVVAPEPLPKGKVVVEGRLAKDGALTLKANGKQVAKGESPGPLAIEPGDPLEGGADHHTAVGEYEAPNPFQGRIASAVVQVIP
jgi:arylsulfatase A-like enzyme